MNVSCSFELITESNYLLPFSLFSAKKSMTPHQYWYCHPGKHWYPKTLSFIHMYMYMFCMCVLINVCCVWEHVYVCSHRGQNQCYMSSFIPLHHAH